MRKALVFDDVVVNVIWVGPESNYVPPVGYEMIDATEDAVIGATRVDGVFVPPVVPEPPLDPVVHLAAYRWEKENGGVVVGGLPVLTDQFTRTNLIGARIRAMEDPSYSVQWKTPAGFFVLGAATIIAVADAVADHVQKCFGAEAAVLANIESYSDAAAIEGAFDGFYNAT